MPLDDLMDVEQPSRDADIIEQLSRDAARRAYRDAWLRGAREDLSFVVKHRTLHHRRHPLRRRLPGRAQHELFEVRDRELLLQQVPTHLVNVWVEDDVHEGEAVAVPLTGWSTAGGPGVVLTFDTVVADLDTKPLLASHTHGTLQVATELHLTCRGDSLRVWRFGAPNQEIHACGKRTISLLPAGGAVQRALREASGDTWHAMSDDHGLLLSLDAPSVGTDALADVWHVVSGRVTLPTATLYQALAPALPPLLRAPPTAAQTAACVLHMRIADAHGEPVASAAWPVALAVHRPAARANELRRVACLEAVATPTTAPTLRSHARAADAEAFDAPYVPSTGSVWLSLCAPSGGRLLDACAFYVGALESLHAPFALGEAVYADESGVTQREAMEGVLSYDRLVRRHRDQARDADGAHDTAADGAEGAGTNDAPVTDAAVDDAVPGECVTWDVVGVRLSLRVPAEAVEGVAFSPHACDARWAESLMRLLPHAAVASS
jgi:hypothetical protein